MCRVLFYFHLRIEFSNENKRGPCTLSPQICEGLPTSTRQYLPDSPGPQALGATSEHVPQHGPRTRPGPFVDGCSLALSIHRARRPYQFPRSAGHINSPGPQALSINQVRRPYQYTWSACRVKSPGPQALLIHQVRRPYQSTRFKGLINSQGPQALSLHQVRRPYQSTRSAGRINSPGPQALSINQVIQLSGMTSCST